MSHNQYCFCDNMGVQKDAGELLLFFYDELVSKGTNGVQTKEVLDATGWDGRRINFAYNYLNDLHLLQGQGGSGNLKGAQNFTVMRLFPQGINIIESVPEFKKTFGFEVNIGLLKFSWSTTEK